MKKEGRKEKISEVGRKKGESGGRRKRKGGEEGKRRRKRKEEERRREKSRKNEKRTRRRTIGGKGYRYSKLLGEY